MRYQYDSQRLENTLYFLSPSPITIGMLVTLGGVLNDWWQANWQPLVATEVELTEIFLADLTSETGSIYSFVAGLPLGGTVGAEAMPANVAPCISFRTGVRGRSFRGRNYLIGIDVDNVASNHIAADYLTDAIDAYNALATAVAAEDWQHAVVSRYSGYTVVDGKKVPTPRVAGLATPVLSYAFTDDVVDSQRGRLPNH